MNNANVLLGVLILALLGGCNSMDAVDTNLIYPQLSCEGQVRVMPAPVPPLKRCLKVYCAYPAALSRRLSGQNAGHGDQINDQNSLWGTPSPCRVIDRTGKVPAILGLDYEHDRIYSPSQLSSANATLIAHAKAGGIVTINWAPLSPWVNDASDLINHPGDWLETRTEFNNPDGKARYINLSELLTEGQPANRVWRKRLDGVADALGQLQAAGVPVLWRPLQEMGGTHFWWGPMCPLRMAQATVPSGGTCTNTSLRQNSLITSCGSIPLKRLSGQDGVYSGPILAMMWWMCWPHRLFLKSGTTLLLNICDQGACD